mmetsp:Transcript_65066/g.74770  ORF Transcript_65066/g.74770 Transcript_65066/m.74770 type:complete len:201 (-) Transcript_65066:84-686(-)
METYSVRKLKLVVVGDQSVGKTALLRRLTGQGYSGTSATIGSDLFHHQMPIDGRIIELEIWDTAGQSKSSNLPKTYIQGVHGVVLVCDLANRESLESFPGWRRLIQENRQKGNFQTVQVCNKIDLEGEGSEMTREDVVRESERLKIRTIFTSAKTGVNVDRAFRELAEKILDAPGQEDLRASFVLKNSKKKKFSSSNPCC